MSIRAAILAAASHIEQHPSDYCFMSVVRPLPEITAGCALGWIGYYADIPASVNKYINAYLPCVVEALDVVSESEFYDRMDSYNLRESTWPWTRNAQRCAAALRMYAEEFYPE